VVNFFLILVFILLLWSGLVFPLSSQEAIVGLVLSIIITGLLYPYIKGKETFKPSRIGSFVLFFFIFMKELIKANIDMAIIVLSPSLPISPKIIKVKTTIRSKVGRAFLANAITLTPGTLSVDLDNDDLYIHVVNGDSVQQDEDVLQPFETLLKGAFDQ